VPILDSRGVTYASVGTAGPIVRYAPEHVRRQLASCREAAAKIAAALGLQVWETEPRLSPGAAERNGTRAEPAGRVRRSTRQTVKR
jgi:hypothetical protein